MQCSRQTREVACPGLQLSSRHRRQRPKPIRPPRQVQDVLRDKGEGVLVQNRGKVVEVEVEVELEEVEERVLGGATSAHAWNITERL